MPTLYLYKHVRVRADRTLVKIYFGTELIKVHPRKAPGGRSTDTSNYPVGKAHYALRSIDALVDRAKAKGTHVGIYAERLLAGPLPWTRMRQAYSLLRLCDKYGDGRVEADHAHAQERDESLDSVGRPSQHQARSIHSATLRATRASVSNSTRFEEGR